MIAQHMSKYDILIQINPYSLLNCDNNFVFVIRNNIAGQSTKKSISRSPLNLVPKLREGLVKARTDHKFNKRCLQAGAQKVV